MLRKDPGPSNRRSPPAHPAKISPRTENQQNESSKSTGGPWPLLLQAIGTYRKASTFLGKPILRTTIAITNKKNGPEAGSQSIRRRPGTLSLPALHS